LRLFGKVFHSLSESKTGFPVAGGIVKPRISYFTRDAVHFVDGSSEPSVDSLVVATGYQVRIPFLEDGGALAVDPKARSSNTSTIFPQPRTPLTTNLRYIRPLYKQILSLSTEFPPNALYFVGLPVNVSNAPSDQAQALFVAHTLADPTLLPSRLDLLSELEEWEELLRKNGYDPDHMGHSSVDLVGNGESRSAYPDGVVDFLKARNVEGLPLRGSGARYTEDWRRRSGLTQYLGVVRNAWARVESLGPEEVRKRLKGRRTEEDWANLINELLDSEGAD
jgi:Flavin-binding monooxygenase-like